MNKYIGISKPLNVVRGRNANLDAKYGPYDSINHAISSIPIAVRRVGLTVGIIFLEETVETVKEYWWKNGVEDIDLELKIDNAASTKTSQLENDADFQDGNQVSASLQAQRNALDATDLNLQNQINTHSGKITTINQKNAVQDAQIQDIITSYIDNKGYFATLTSLQASYPAPEVGDTAYVANALSSTGYYIYNVVGGIWTSSTVEAPPVIVPINDYTLSGGSPKTLKEVEDNASVKMTNLLQNSSFENGVIAPMFKTDGDMGASTLSINTISPISGDYDARLEMTTPSTSFARPIIHLNGYQDGWALNHVFYFGMSVKVNSGTPAISRVFNGGGDVSLNLTLKDGFNSWTVECTGLSNFAVIYLDGRTLYDFNFDNIIAYDLTAIFGEGNEPTKEEMDLLISTLGIDYFEGEIIIPAQKIMQRQLKLVNTAAQNTEEAIQDAITALDFSNLATKQELEDNVSQLADIATLKIENLAINGDFTNGITGWRGADDISISVEEGTLEMLSSSTSGSGRILPEYPFSVAVGDVIYRRAVVMSTSNLVGLGFASISTVKHSGSGSYEVLSFIRDATSTSEYISVVDGRKAGWDSIEITSMIAVNLTEVFGSGNEPSKAKMDELISQIGYFEGERSMSMQEMTQWQSYLFAKNERVNVMEETVSQLQDTAVIKMENLVKNGDFESGLLGQFYKLDGGGGASTLEINTVNPISGNYDAKLTITSPSSSGRPYLEQINNYVGVPENIYYLRFEAKITSGTPRLFGIMTGGGVSSIYEDIIGGLNSFTIECDGLTPGFGRYYMRSPELWEMQMDNFMVINLTEVFGAGSEPNKMEFETLLDILGVKYFEGEMVVPSKELLRWIKSGTTTTETYSNFKDNLTNLNTGNVEVLSGSYGGDDAIYKIPVQSDVFRMVFDFYMNTDVNNESPHGDIVSFIRSGNVVNSIKTLNAKTTTIFRQYSDNPSSLLQVPKYNSGFTILGNSSVRDALYHEPIVGETIFSIWLKGSDKPLDDFYNTNKVEGEQWLADREQWLSDYRDYAIVIEDDTFSIVRDGIDVTEDAGAFNGGATSTLYSTSLKSEGEWRTLKSLYEELKSLTEVGGVLENFWMNFYALSSRKNCGDIHQFGKVKMVGRYYQQITNINTDYGVQQQMRYDSFPVLVKYAVDDKKHICEIVGINGKIYAQVDGEMFSSDIPYLEYITIGGAIKPTNLEVVNGSLGDAEIVNVDGGTIISQRSPYTVGIMGHELIDEMEGPGVGDGLEQSLTRMHDVCILLRERGYTVVSIDDLIKMRANGIYPSKRIAFFVFDDRRIENVYQNFRHRQAISKYGYPANLASIMGGSYEDNPSVYQPIITAMRGNGWNNLSHTYFHNIPYRVKNSVILWAELKEILRVADLLNMNNNALCYAFSAGWDVTHTMLEMGGFALAILNNIPYYSKLSRNKYMIARVNMADGESWNNVSYYIC